MRLHYYVDPNGNFGDDLNALVWPALVGDLLDEDGHSLLVGIGTLLNDRLPPEPLKAVLGSGVGYGQRALVDGSWVVYCVRGPLSAAALGLDPGVAVTDSALLVRLLELPPPAARRIVLMPHHTTSLRAEVEGLDLRAVCDQLGVQLLDPAAPVAASLAVLRGAELVLADAMHAAIVADALRVPWVPLALYDHVDETKWQDWSSSLGLQHRPVRRPHDATERSVAECLQRARRSPQMLSSDADSDRALERLQECVEHFRADVGRGRFQGHPGEAWQPEAPSPRAQRWRQDVVAGARRAGSCVPRAAALAMAGSHEWLVDGCLSGRRVIPLDASGPPPDDATASRLLAQASAEGAEALVLTSSSSWWLEAFPSLREQVELPALVEDDVVSVHRLRRTAP